jgi:hypothetical protein
VSYWAHTFMPDQWARREAAQRDHRYVKPEDQREYAEWLAHISELPATEEDRWRWEFNLLTPEDRAEFEAWLRSSDLGSDNDDNNNTITKD